MKLLANTLVICVFIICVTAAAIYFDSYILLGMYLFSLSIIEFQNRK